MRHSVETSSQLRGLRRGNPGNKGGGQKPWIWGELCRQALQNAKADIVLAKIIAGDLHEVIGMTKDGEPIVGETKNADRIKAMQLALSYAIGLPVQPTVDLTPREPAHVAASALIDAIPRLLGILPGNAHSKAKLLEALEVEGEIVD